MSSAPDSCCLVFDVRKRPVFKAAPIQPSAQLAHLQSVRGWSWDRFTLNRPAVALLVLLSAIVCTMACGGRGICSCTPTASASQDFRHAEKHVPLPNITPTEITVAQILGWALGPDPTNTTPRTGQELTLYHVANAYLQNARLISFDCDVHLEISDLPAKTAPRVIVETPIDSEYCANRHSLQDALSRHHFHLRYVVNADVSQSELPQPLAVSALGLAFRDFEHGRGSQEVGTPWELHPAEVTVLQ